MTINMYIVSYQELGHSMGVCLNVIFSITILTCSLSIE